MRALVFDTETNGLINNIVLPLQRQPRIIEFFGLTLNEHDEEVDQKHFLFNIGEKLDAVITRITGLNDEDLRTAPRFAACADEMLTYIQSHDEVVAHNLAFDSAMVNMEYARLARAVQWPRMTCTVESSQWVKGYRLSLTALHTELFGTGFEGAHRAETDVRALSRCYIEMRKKGWI